MKLPLRELRPGMVLVRIVLHLGAKFDGMIVFDTARLRELAARPACKTWS